MINQIIPPDKEVLGVKCKKGQGKDIVYTYNGRPSCLHKLSKDTLIDVLKNVKQSARIYLE